jgi:hypothetical protein
MLSVMLVDFGGYWRERFLMLDAGKALTRAGHNIRQANEQKSVIGAGEDRGGNGLPDP